MHHNESTNLGNSTFWGGRGGIFTTAPETNKILNKKVNASLCYLYIFSRGDNLWNYIYMDEIVKRKNCLSFVENNDRIDEMQYTKSTITVP